MKTSLPSSLPLVDVTVSVLPVSAWGGTSQREGQSRAAETRARITGTERGRCSASEKEGKAGKYLMEIWIHCIISALISKVPPDRGTSGFYRSCFLLQRLEEIMRRTRRTDSADMVKTPVFFSSKNNAAVGPSWRTFRIHWQVATQHVLD